MFIVDTITDVPAHLPTCLHPAPHPLAITTLLSVSLSHANMLFG